MYSEGMLDWSASECKDYKDRIMATVACACPVSSVKLHDTWEWRGPCCLVRVHRQTRKCLFTPTRKESIWQGLTVQPQRITHVKPQDQSFLSSVIENVKSVELLRARKVDRPWTGETCFKVTTDACGNSVFRTCARILVPVSDMSPMAIADSGALHDTKAAKPVNLRLAAGRSLQWRHRETQLTALWTPQTLTLNCVNKSGTAQGLMQRSIKGDTAYFTAVQFWMLRRAPSTSAYRSEALSTSVLETAVLDSDQ